MPLTLFSQRRKALRIYRKVVHFYFVDNKPWVRWHYLCLRSGSDRRPSLLTWG